MKNNLSNKELDNIKKLDWKSIQNEMKSNFGNDIYDSWLKKIDLVDELNNYVLISVSTRFIRDWIASRYLDQILKIIKSFKKDISRVEFIISDNNNAKGIEVIEDKSDEEIPN